jgi:outer membrane protein
MRAGLLTGLGLLLCCLPERALSQAPRTDSLTVEAAVEAVLRTHPMVRGASQQIAAAEARVGQRRSGYYPEIDAAGRYDHLAPVASITLGDSAFTLYPPNNYNVNVGIRQTLFDFGKRSAAVDYARAQVDGANEQLALTESDLAFRTIDAFYAILYFRQDLTIQDQQIAALDEHLQAVRTRVSAGTATDFDVLTTQVRSATAKSRRADVANQLRKQTIALRELLGMPGDTPLPLVGTLEVTPVDLDRDARVAFALAHRREIRLAQTAEAAAHLQHRLAALGNKPTIRLDLTVGVKNGYVPNLNALKANLDAGMEIDLPIFNGFRTRNDVAESQAELGSAGASTAVVTRRVIASVDQAIADLETSLEKIRTASLQVQQAEQALALADTRYAADTAEAEARLLEVAARLDFVLSRYALDRAVGNTPW